MDGTLQIRKLRPKPGVTCPRSLSELKTIRILTLNSRLCVYCFFPPCTISNGLVIMKAAVIPYHGGAEEKWVQGTANSVPCYWAPSFPSLHIITLHFPALDTSHAPIPLHFCTICSFFQILLPHTLQTGKLLPMLPNPCGTSFQEPSMIPAAQPGLLLGPQALTTSVFKRWFSPVWWGCGERSTDSLSLLE